MSGRKEEKFSNISIWQNLDFKAVQQRVKRITDKLEKVRDNPQSRIQASHSDVFSEVEQESKG